DVPVAVAESRRRFSTYLPPARLFALAHDRVLAVTTQNTLEVGDIDPASASSAAGAPGPTPLTAASSRTHASPAPSQFIGGCQPIATLSAVRPFPPNRASRVLGVAPTTSVVCGQVAVFGSTDRLVVATTHSSVAVYA